MNEQLLKKKIGYLQNVYSQTLRSTNQKSFNKEAPKEEHVSVDEIVKQDHSHQFTMIKGERRERES